MPDSPVVALLGTGIMGAGMARNLAAAGLPLRVWNRNRSKAEPLAEAGATVAATPAEAVAGADIVITMLWDAASVLEVLEQAREALAPGTIWVQSSTVGLAGLDRLAEFATKHDLVLVDAPVLGTRQPAESGTLVVLAGGPDGVRSAVAPVFEAIGSRTVWAGPAGAASRLKLVANAWVLLAIEGIAECLTLAESLGLEQELFLEAVRGGAMDAPYVGMKGRAMLAGDFAPAFTLAGGAKDAELIMAAALAGGADIAVLAAAGEHIARAAAEHGDLDLAGTYLTHRP